jgi:hypothetical protein
MGQTVRQKQLTELMVANAHKHHAGENLDATIQELANRFGVTKKALRRALRNMYDDRSFEKIDRKIKELTQTRELMHELLAL